MQFGNDSKPNSTPKTGDRLNAALNGEEASQLNSSLSPSNTQTTSDRVSDVRQTHNEALNLNTRSLRETQREIQALELALDFVKDRNLVLSTPNLEETITIQITQTKRAFEWFAKGGSPEEYVTNVLGDAVVMPLEQDAAPDSAQNKRTLRDLEEVRGKVAALLRTEENKAISAKPSEEKAGNTPPTDEKNTSPTALAEQNARLSTIFRALDYASAKIIADFRDHETLRATVDMSDPQLCKFRAEMEILDRVAPWKGAIRHSIETVIRTKEIGSLVFKDILWVASALFHTGYSEDVIAAAILLHANNDLDKDKGAWLSEASTSFSSETQKLVAAVKSAPRDFGRAPEHVSELNFQRPPDISQADEPLLHQAHAIACASILSPSWEVTECARFSNSDPQISIRENFPGQFRYLHKLLEARQLFREPHIPTQFKELLKAKCQSGAVDITSSTSPTLTPQSFSDVRPSAVINDIESTLHLFQRLFESCEDGSSVETALASIHSGTQLVFDFISQGASSTTIREILAEPFDDAVGASSALSQRITDDYRRERHEQGFLLNLDVSAPLTSERYRNFIAFICRERTQADENNPKAISLAEFLSKVRVFTYFSEKKYGTVIDKVEDKIVHKLQITPEQEPDFIERGNALVKQTNRAFSLLERSGLRYVYNSADLTRELLHRGGLEKHIIANLLLAAKERDYVLKRSNQQFEEMLVAFITSEIYRLITEPHASELQKLFVTALNLRPQTATPRDLSRPRYSADELNRFSVASKYLLDHIVKLEKTGTPRDRVGSFRHALEVGITLALVGAPAEIVVAGILHDLYELAAPDELKEIRRSVRSSFGLNVDRLVNLMSEERGPEKPSFLARKMGVFTRLLTYQEQDPVLVRNAITILLAAKVSTLGEGLFFLEEKGVTQPWSKGDYLDNLHVMLETRKLAGRLCQHNEIFDLFDTLMKRWCNAAHGPSAQVRLGIEYRDGSERVPQDQGKALELFKEAAQAGEPRGMYELGKCYLEGIAAPQNPFAAVKLFTKLLTHLTPENWLAGRDCYAALERMYSGNTPKVDSETQQKIMELLNATLADGSAEAGYQLGMCSLYAWGVPKSSARAAMLFEESLRLGTIKDTRVLGDILSKLGRLLDQGGHDLSPDPERAAQYYERGISYGNRDAYSGLAGLYREGRGVPKDTEKANSLARRSFFTMLSAASVSMDTTLLQKFWAPRKQDR